MVTQFIEKFKGTKAWQEMEREERARIQAQREAAVKELAQLTAAEEKAAPARNARVQVAIGAVEKAKDALRDAEAAYAQARNEVLGASHQFDRRRSQLQRQLEETAPAAIGEFIQEMDDLADSIREHIQGVGMAQVRPRVAAIREARAQAEGLKLSADPDINQQIEELRAGLEG